jgi:Zn-dependent alcohol dehydrogenase
LDRELPQTLGHEAAGVVDEIGSGFGGVAIGNGVFEVSPSHPS